jgi:RHS repeat-associated protein
MFEWKTCTIRLWMAVLSLCLVASIDVHAQDSQPSQGGEVAPMGICLDCPGEDPPPANQLPEASITSPANGQQFIAGTVVNVAASAYDPDGTVAYVDLVLDGTTRIGRDTTAPYQFSWTSTVGSHTLAVFPRDNLSADGLGQGITVNVVPNKVPVVSLTSPTNGANIATGTVINLTAAASDSDGSVQRVEFYVDGILVGQDTVAPYTVAWNSTLGTHTVVAKAVDNLNVVGTSTTSNITVNRPPTVSLTAPVSGASFPTGSTVTLTANASDLDGNLSRVDFLINGVKVGQDTTSPYAYAWASSTGNHSAQAKAYDALGASAATPTIALSVNNAPTVSLGAPVTGKEYLVGTAVPLSAIASDSDGTINRVEFLIGSTLVATDTSAPYAASWIGLLGDHQVTARAYDNLGRMVSATKAVLVVEHLTEITRHYVYNANQELCKVIEPETGATIMSYDAAGNLAWSASGLNLPNTTSCDDTDATVAGRKVIRSYDQRNRVDSMSFPDNRGNTTYDYTPDGLLETIVATDGTNTVTTTYQYNARRQLTNEQMIFGAVNWSLAYGYNRNGHLATQTYPWMMINYNPNGLGQPRQAGPFATGVTYHPNGGMASFTYGNGIVHTMTPNARQLPERSRDVYGTGEPVLDDSYDYDANGNVVAISDGRSAHRGNRDMTYDGLNRLKSATSIDMFGGTINYTYDLLDNIQTVVGPNRNQRYCYESGTYRLIFVRNDATSCSGGFAATTLEYDVQGNLTLKNNNRYNFDYGNRLRDVSTTAGTSIASYVYDGHGRRVSDNTTASKYSLYNQAGQLAVTSDGRKAEYRNYIYLNGSLVAMRSWPHSTPTFTVKYQHTDALGTPVAVTDANGNEITAERSEYDPYGKQLNGLPDDLPGYTGHVEDAATGLTYMQQRYYDPVIGRFLSVDPVTADGATGANFNRYWYANNNPYRFKDPDGRKCATADGKDSCTFDGFGIDKKGKEITRDAALGGKFSQLFGRGSKILRAERAMTAKYTAAKRLAAKGGQVAIKGNSALKIPDQNVSGATIVSQMEAIKTIAERGPSPFDTPGRRRDGGVPPTSDGSPSNGPMIFWSDGGPVDAGRMFGHEILHTIYSGIGVPDRGWANPDIVHNDHHQVPFNEASDAIQ